MAISLTQFLAADDALRAADKAIAARADRIATRLVRFPADYARPAKITAAGYGLIDALDFVAWDIDRARGNVRHRIATQLRARPAFRALVDARLAAIRGETA